jgi:hypothetical protein
LLHLLHKGVDRIDNFLIGIGFAIDDDLVDAFLGAVDVDGVPLHMTVPPAAVPGAEEIGVLLIGVGELRAGQCPNIEIPFFVHVGLQFDLGPRR